MLVKSRWIVEWTGRLVLHMSFASCWISTAFMSFPRSCTLQVLTLCGCSRPWEAAPTAACKQHLTSSAGARTDRPLTRGSPTGRGKLATLWHRSKPRSKTVRQPSVLFVWHLLEVLLRALKVRSDLMKGKSEAKAASADKRPVRKDQGNCIPSFEEDTFFRVPLTSLRLTSRRPRLYCPNSSKQVWRCFRISSENAPHKARLFSSPTMRVWVQLPKKMSSALSRAVLVPFHAILSHKDKVHLESIWERPKPRRSPGRVISGWWRHGTSCGCGECRWRKNETCGLWAYA